MCEEFFGSNSHNILINSTVHISIRPTIYLFAYFYLFNFFFYFIFFIPFQVGIIFPLWALLLANFENLLFISDGSQIRVVSFQLFCQFFYLMVGCWVGHILQIYFINLVCERISIGKGGQFDFINVTWKRSQR